MNINTNTEPFKQLQKRWREFASCYYSNYCWEDLSENEKRGMVLSFVYGYVSSINEHTAFLHAPELLALLDVLKEISCPNYEPDKHTWNWKDEN